MMFADHQVLQGDLVKNQGGLEAMVLLHNRKNINSPPNDCVGKILVMSIVIYL